jgi:carboxylate-amine ligase
MTSTRTALTVGVEEEFLVVDAAGQLSYQGEDLVRDGNDAPGDRQHELVRCQVEVATPVCDSAEEVRRRLLRLRTDVGDDARARGLRLLPSGTVPLPQAEEPPITPEPRYERMARWFGAVAHTANTCGCHVHVAVPDREAGVGVIDRVRGWLPVLLALSANSPFENGVDTAHHSWRHVLWSRWPSAGPPPLFGSLDRYESSVEALLRLDAMLDRGMLYWDIRLSDHQPTVEFRVCDVAATAEEAALLAGLIRALVGTALDELDTPPADPPIPHEILNAALWRAAREGMTARLPHPRTGELQPVPELLTELLSRTATAMKAGGDTDLVTEQLARVAEGGNGAQRQRAAHQRRDELTDVVDELAFC